MGVMRTGFSGAAIPSKTMTATGGSRTGGPWSSSCSQFMLFLLIMPLLASSSLFSRSGYVRGSSAMALSSLMQVRPQVQTFSTNISHVTPMAPVDANAMVSDMTGSDADDADELAQSRAMLRSAEEVEALLADYPQEPTSAIGMHEMQSVLASAQRLVSCSPQQIAAEGWKVIHESSIFALYKRSNEAKPMEYLMMGQFNDVSPRTFLLAQVDNVVRGLWDKTMKEMSPGQIEALKEDGLVCKNMEDVSYYRTKWPWPMNDRDYVLSRRCQVFDDDDSIVLVSKSTESASFPEKEGVIRVDKYWCQSAFMSLTRPSPVAVTEEEEEPAPAVAPVDAARPWEPLLDLAEPSLPLPMPLPSSDEVKAAVTSLTAKGVKMVNRILNPSKTKAPSTPVISADQVDGSEEEVPVVATRRKSELCRPGVRFVTIFCEDQKVPLHPKIVAMLSKVAEKVVPESFARLHEVAREEELRQQQE